MNVLSQNDSRLVNATETIMSVAHCIRELIENSLDAQSTIINIRLIGSGLESINISDNGCGINQQGLELLCTEGATSKEFGSDLSGGRGKALDAISSLSMISVESCCSNDQKGYRLYFNEEGERIIEPCVRSKGTSITVQSIFYTFPVRRRYWISHKSVLIAQIQEVCASFAISTNISLTALNDNRNIIQISNYNRQQRIRSILGSNIAQGLITGKAVLDKWIPGSTLEYFTSSPTTNSNGKIILSVNGRPVSNNSIARALKQEFHLCAGPKEPTIILYITSERKNFDFHPNDPIIGISFKSELVLQQELRLILGDAWKKTSETLTFKDVTQKENSFEFPPKPSDSKHSKIKLKPNLTAQIYNSSHISNLTTEKIQERLYKSRNYNPDFGPSNNTIVTESFDQMEIIGQWNKSFLITRLGSDIYAIDQHAACEAQNFEKLRKQATKKKQVLLNPFVIKASPEDLENAESHKEEISKFGFDYEIKDDSIYVYAIPSDKNVVNDLNDLQELIGLIHDVPNSTPMTHNARIQLAYHACHSSVRVGDVMDNNQIKKLLHRMANSDYPWNCPHGRPTWCCIKILGNEESQTQDDDRSSPHPIDENFNNNSPAVLQEISI